MGPVLSVSTAQNTHCHHQQPRHRENSLCGQGKGRETGARTWELPFPHASSQCHQAPGHLQQQETTMYGKKGHTRVVAAVQIRKAKLTHVVRDKQGNSSLMMAVEGPGHPLQHRGDTVTPLCYGHSSTAARTCCGIPKGGLTKARCVFVTRMLWACCRKSRITLWASCYTGGQNWQHTQSCVKIAKFVVF